MFTQEAAIFKNGVTYGYHLFDFFWLSVYDVLVFHLLVTGKGSISLIKELEK